MILLLAIGVALAAFVLIRRWRERRHVNALQERYREARRTGQLRVIGERVK